MRSSGFTSTPTTAVLLSVLILTSVLTSITSTKHQVPLYPVPHLYPYLQLHRLLTHQLAYTSSTELLFSGALLYQLRALERLFGTRKFTSLLVVAAAWNAVLSPLVLAGLVRPLTRGAWDHLPAGATGPVFAALAVWGDEVPRLWRYEVVLPPLFVRSGNGAAAPRGWSLVTLSDKLTTYLLSLQVALAQFPYSLLPAAVGYFIGLAWAADFLPGRMSGWRVPRWVVGEASMWAGGEKSGVERGRYEGLRRRLEEEGGRAADGDGDGDGDGDAISQAAHASGSRGADGQRVEGQARRRPMGAQIADYFRGVF